MCCCVQVYKLDNRVAIVENTLGNPASISDSVIYVYGTTGSCPTVPKTFVNKDSCVRKSTCAATVYSSVKFTLNEANLKMFYDLSTKYVYRISGLTLTTSNYAKSPCTKNYVSRWLKHSGTCQGAIAKDETVFPDAATKATLLKLLEDSTDANPFVRDIYGRGPGTTCTSEASSVGARIQVGGTCWEQVNPDHYDVVDATYWTVAHPGNGEGTNTFNPIRSIAEAGNFDLVYPASHPMDRWRQKYKRFPVLGRFGDEVDFKDLHSNVQTNAVAAKLGATSAGSAKGFEACGSRGEVSNADVAKGTKYQMYIADLIPGTKGLVQSQGQGHSKFAVWGTIALKGEDQLRQRVAWALAQVWVLSESGAPNRIQENECWHGEKRTSQQTPNVQCTVWWYTVGYTVCL
jgi:hypothetical protein